MEISLVPIKTLDGEDTEAQRKCQKFYFELHGNVIYQNVRLWTKNPMVPKSTIFEQGMRITNGIDNTLEQFLSFLSHIFHRFSWTQCNRNTNRISQFLSLKDASMKLQPFHIKTLDVEDTEAQREGRKLNFELNSKIIHQNICLWKINCMVP